MSDEDERESALDALAGVPLIQMDEREERPAEWPVGGERCFVLTPLQLQNALLMWAAIEHGLPAGRYCTTHSSRNDLRLTIRRDR